MTIVFPKPSKLELLSPAQEIRRLGRRLRKMHKQERLAIRQKDDTGAVFWGMLAGETWGRMVQLAEDHNLDHVLPAQQGPLLDSQ